MRYAPFLLVFLVMGLVSCDSAVQEPTDMAADTQQLLCLEPITCENGDCDLGRAVDSPAECTDGLFARLRTTGFVSFDAAKRATVSESMLALLDHIGILPSVAIAQQSDLYFGIRDGQNMSGPGTGNRCEAKLHPCFVQGTFDLALNDVDTAPECKLACTYSNSPSQQSCSYIDCYSRCLVSRVPDQTTYADCT